MNGPLNTMAPGRRTPGKRTENKGPLAELLSRCPVPLREIKDEMERGGVLVSRDTLQSWAVGRSWPREANLRALAAALSRIGERVTQLGEEVVRADRRAFNPADSA